jgi:hypothetical protein
MAVETRKQNCPANAAGTWTNLGRAHSPHPSCPAFGRDSKEERPLAMSMS